MTFSSFNRRFAPWLCGAALGWAAAASAQSPACDQFKEAVATRIPPEVRGALETVPAATPVPPGAKVVGTCDGGAFKILHYRRGLTPQGATAASAPGATNSTSPASPASAASAVAVAPRVAARASAPAAAASRPEPAKPVAAKLPEPVKPVAPKPPEPAASPVAMAPAVAPALPDTRDEPLMRDPPPLPEGPGLIATTTDTLVEHWPWTLAAILLPLVAWGWSWFLHRRVYDAAGLPRGPKL